MNTSPTRQRGFTLLEMLVAVAVLAIAMAAIITNGARYASGAASLRDKSIALWVARNHLAEVELLPNWPNIGKSNDDVKMGGIEWTWRTEVISTQDPTLRRLNIRVEKKGERSAIAYATLTSFVSNVGRQEQ
ncbi:MAG: type II secretion system minor pseudopilin GspI [Nevskia sp.]|jgi:general secretion pathway protein I|nr:type II secretion system minor pseudopilin GspI [Nevskia sp.]MCK9384178.1 type II secretion system minor pseudopilin GspI [Nevskia sp.]